MKTIYISFLTALLGFLCQCKEEPIGQLPIESVSPGKVMITEVKPIPGGAIITYTPPSDLDLLYVKAEYSRNGKLASTLSSSQKNTVKIEGLPPYTESIDVILTAVDNSKNESDPITIKVTPLESPLLQIFDSFEAKADFGGFSAKWKNETATEIGVTVLCDSSSLGVFKEVSTYYSKKNIDSTLFEPFRDIKTKFKIYITDKWGNQSPEKEFELTPYYETKLDGTTFKLVKIVRDAGNKIWNWDFSWDKMFVGEGDAFPWFLGGDYSPSTITLDMGKLVKLSKYKYWGRDDAPYGGATLRNWEIWGINDFDQSTIQDTTYWSNNADAPWKKEWHLLGSFIMHKPSGDESAVTAEDIAVAKQGFLYKFDPANPPVRYFRIVVHRNWAGGSGMCIGDLKMWGDDKNFN